jgi:hypothetical protein
MEFVRMITRKLIIDGYHYDVVFYNQDDGTCRVEVSHNVTGKHYKMFPDNVINFEESNNE